MGKEHAQMRGGFCCVACLFGLWFFVCFFFLWDNFCILVVGKHATFLDKKAQTLMIFFFLNFFFFDCTRVLVRALFFYIFGESVLSPEGP